MLYPKTIERKIGFDTIRSILLESCQFEEGKRYVSEMHFSHDYHKVSKRLEQTCEMLQLIQLGEIIIPHCIDSRKHLKNIRVKGSFLEPDEILDIVEALFSAEGISNKISNQTEPFLQLKVLSGMVYFDRSIPVRIKEKFDGKGNLKDNASSDLRRIRLDKKKVSGKIRNSLDLVFREAKTKGFVPENSNPTFRDGRFVIPVIASHKRRVKGFVHDESATGHTVYIEPSEVLEANNAIVELGYAEKREEIKILKKLFELIRNDSESIDSAFQYLGLIDFILAKASLAQKIGAVMPLVTHDNVFELKNARHPILYLGHLKEKKKVVPLNIKMDEKDRVFLISGPNAGGKSVCLKTVGLIQYMLQCGLLPSVHPDSRMGLFKDIFVDIGDEQSIENDLSTYSSHLENMRVFISKSGKDSLILIDEFGTGTDPQFGGAIAEAILEELLNNNCFGVITTHYGNLKEFAQGSDGIKNGAMQFDLGKLEPLYILEPDKPGSSFALEVANKIGLSKRVLERARTIAGVDSVEVENLINKLTEQERVLSAKLHSATEQEKYLQKSQDKYDSLQSDLEEESESIIQKARIEASEILSVTNKKIEKTIRHIKENRAQKTETNRVREGLAKFKKSIKPSIQKKGIKNDEIEFLAGAIKNGDDVLVNDSQLVGEVVEIKGNSARILVGNLQLQVKVNQLRKIKRSDTATSFSVKKSSSQNIDLTEKRRNFSELLDIRGKRSNEVQELIDRFIDNALLLGFHDLRVLHGKGDGVLRKMVREQLNSLSQVVRVEDEHIEHGGAGITVVSLKN